MSKLKLPVSAAAAGFLIGIGGTVYLSLDNKLAGSVLFAVGLFAILSFGLHLFTGRVCYIPDNKPTYIIDLLLIWAGNLAGAFLCGMLVRATRLGSSIAEKALALCAVKQGDGIVSLFVLGIFCGIMMFVAVDCYKNVQDPLGKYIGIFVCVPVFILSGFEHCVANMYYFSLALAWTPVSFAGMAAVTLGNAAGGVLLPLVRKAITEKPRNRPLY